MSTIIYKNEPDLCETIARKLVSLSHKKKKRVNIVLSGGETPKKVFNKIANLNDAYEINWAKLNFWWTDERNITMESKNNNYGEAKRILFDRVQCPESNIHPLIINNTDNLKNTISQYIKKINNKVEIVNKYPRFDWIWLGVGEDGHTASIFDKNEIFTQENKWLNIVKNIHVPHTRITLTLDVINNAKNIDFLITGERKAKIMCKILGKANFRCPATLVAPRLGKVIWHIEEKSIKGIPTLGNDLITQN